MTSLLFTLIFAFVVVLFAIACLAISWLVTGKSKIQMGSCGRAPKRNQGKDVDCGIDVSCYICKKPNDDDKKDKK